MRFSGHLESCPKLFRPENWDTVHTMGGAKERQKSSLPTEGGSQRDRETETDRVQRIERRRDRETESERQRVRDRETERQTHRETERQRDRQN